MEADGCQADGVVLGAIASILWDTGIVSAQQRAWQLHQRAGAASHVNDTSRAPMYLELTPSGAAAGNALLALHAWLVDMRCAPPSHPSIWLYGPIVQSRS